MKNVNNMKFLKNFENLIKKTDDKVINTPLKPLIDELENILNCLSEFEYKNYKIKKYYSNGVNDVNIKMILYENSEIELLVYLHSYTLTNQKYYITFQVFSNIFEINRFKKLKLGNDIKDIFKNNNLKYNINQCFFDINDIDIIVNDLKKIRNNLELENSIKKYNL